MLLLQRRDFSGPDAVRALERSLRDRIARLPGGVLQLARMAEIDQRARRPASRKAVHTFAAVCLVVYALEYADPFVVPAGSFIPSMVAQGEIWRLATAHFLHDPLLFPLHLGLNLACILIIGLRVERVLGSLRAVVVMGASGLGAMLFCAFAGYPEVIGASGVAAGLAGALLCLEIHGSRRLPAAWRIPRRLFVAALMLQATLDLFVPFIAGAAHLGGFVAGYAVTRIWVRDALLDVPATGVAWAAGTALVGAVVLALLAASPLARHDASAIELHALRLIHGGAVSIIHDNQVAWLLATEVEPSRVRLQAAEALAQRAVERSGRGDPDLLDTLAEVRFAAGNIAGALAIIDEAIDLARGEVYFQEQRRRFTGERAADDRPAPPQLPWSLRARMPGGSDRDSPLIDPYAPGITI